MVTTRSADKRVDGRDEDLVLRSRTIISPASQDTTPSRTRKRVSTNVDAATPVPKRMRKLISVQINSPRTATSVSSQSAVQEDESTRESTLNVDDNKTATSADLVPSDIGQTPRQHDVFQTPATSRHMRFESAEVEDTIVVNRDQSSTSQQGYETAEEVIADSDEAPEISSTKTRSTRPQSTSNTRTRNKSRARAADFFSQRHEEKGVPKTPATITETLDTILETAEVNAQIQQELEDSVEQTLESQKPIEPVSHDLETVVNSKFNENTNGEMHSTDDTVAPHEGKAASSVELDKSVELPESIAGPIKESVPSEHTSELVQTPTAALDESLTPRFDDNNASREFHISSPNSTVESRLSLRPKFASKINRTQLHDTLMRKHSADGRLPDPTNSSRSRLVRQKLEGRGRKLQSSWPSKRSAFVTS